MKNVTSLVIALRVIAITCLLGLSACNNPFFDWEDHGGGKPGDPPLNTNCTVSGKMVAVTCGPSIYGNLWIKTEAGEFLRPCDQSFQTLCPIDLKDGDVVKFSYRKISNCSKCDEITCLATIPKHTNVVIDCISVVPSSGNCASLLLDPNSVADQTIHVLESSIQGNLLKLKIGYSGCSALPTSAFKLSWNGGLAKSLPPQAYLNLGLTVTPTLCQAYFTTDLCFDVSRLKTSSSGQSVLIRIGDHSVLF